VQRPAPPPPPPAPAAQRELRAKVARPLPSRFLTVTLASGANLPVEGRQLLDAHTAQIQQIQQDADARIAASRQSMIKALEALQDRLTKDGKLDEAIAVRDYLRGVRR
jgi:hypothetical protein